MYELYKKDHSNSRFNSDDIIIVYDESMLSATIDGPREEEGKTVMKVVFTGNTGGRSEVFIATGYELVEKGEKATGYSKSFTYDR